MRDLFGASGVVGGSNQQVGEKPFLQNLSGALRQKGKADSGTTVVIGPHHLTTAMQVFPSFRQFEAKRNGTIDFQALIPLQIRRYRGLNRETIFVQVEQFTQVNDNSRLWSIEAD